MSEIEKYMAPSDLAEAVKALASGGVTILAGGTDLTPQIEAGRRTHAATLMNIRHIDALAHITQENGEIKIGSLVTVSEIRDDKLLLAAAPILCAAANHFASEQIRNAATLGGNICNASPAGDMIIPLLVLGTSVEISRWQAGKTTSRREDLADFFTGPGKSILQDHELVTAVIFKKPAANFVGQFRKSGPRPALEISTVSVAIGGDVTAGKFENVRVAFGAVGPTPLRSLKAEAALEGQILSQDVIQAAIAAAQEDAAPIDDIRASAWYRNHLIAVFTEELLNNVTQNRA